MSPAWKRWMNKNDEDTNTTHSLSQSSRSTHSPTPSQSHSEASDFLGSDQATLSGGSYHSIESSSESNSFIANSLGAALSNAMSSLTHYSPPVNTSAPNASVLKHLTKLATANFVAWKQDLKIHLDACGLGSFILSKVPEPTAIPNVPLWRMHHAQVLLAIRTTINGHNLNAISSAQHPHPAITILSRRHGHRDNVGLVVENPISAIVFQEFDS